MEIRNNPHEPLKHGKIGGLKSCRTGKPHTQMTPTPGSATQRRKLGLKNGNNGGIK